MVYLTTKPPNHLTTKQPPSSSLLSMPIPADARLDTLLQHHGEEEKFQGAVVPPIFQNSLFVFDDAEELAGLLQSPDTPNRHVYSRVTNPTLDIVCRKLAMLEGTDAALVTSSGMAAISGALLSVVEAGAHVVAIDTCYGPAKLFLTNYLPRFGVTTTYVDGRDACELIEALRPETKAVYLESPSTALFRLQDFQTISNECRARGITTICDNSYCSPIYQNPAKNGIDIVVHTASKYLGGHSDIIAGAICASNEAIGRLMRPDGEIPLLGTVLAPFPAWLMLRGLRTLKIRVETHARTANEVARWLVERSEVERVHHTGLDSYPQSELRDRQMLGTGGLLSFEPRVQSQAKIYEFVNQLRIFQRGVSWGGFESLAIPLTVQPGDFPQPRNLVRLYCGLEDVRDLIADLEQAITTLA